MSKMRRKYPNENILDRYMHTNTRMGETPPHVHESLKKYMSKEDIRILESLPEEVTIYRGTNTNEANGDIYDMGQSWTLDIETAKFFALKHYSGINYKSERCVLVAKIKREHIFGYIGARNESEVIVNYTKLYDVKIT